VQIHANAEYTTHLLVNSWHRAIFVTHYLVYRIGRQRQRSVGKNRI